MVQLKSPLPGSNGLVEACWYRPAWPVLPSVEQCQQMQLSHLTLHFSWGLPRAAPVVCMSVQWIGPGCSLPEGI